MIRLGVVGLALVMAGCYFSLPKDLYEVRDYGCEELSLEDLAVRIEAFHPGSKTSDLSCALLALRAVRPSEIHRTAAAAKVCYLLADRHVDSHDRERLASEGMRWAEIALDGDATLKGRRGEGSAEEGRLYYFLGVNLGIAVHDHTALAIKHLERLADTFQRAVKLCPGEDDGGPLRVLGLLYLMAPPWPKGIGDGDRALEMLSEAVQKYPDHPLNQVFYAQALFDVEQDDGQKMREHLRRGMELLKNDRWGGAAERWRALLRDLASRANIKVLPDENLN